MGILNVTTDSFSDGGKYFETNSAVDRAFEIENLGADILDIGAQSSRPNFTRISPEEELQRIIPVLEKLQDRIKIPISVDTFYPKVAEIVLKHGVSIVNDVNGLKGKMFEVVSKSDCGIVIMHSPVDLTKENDIKSASDTRIVDFFTEQIKKAEKYKIEKSRICLDPGIGFGKCTSDNLYILANIDKFKIRGYAFLIGVSRKRVIGDSTNTVPEKRLYGTIAAHSIAQFFGANILRVHDIKEAVQAASVIDDIKKYIK
jgi:dihydropteroate synthase